MGSNDQNLQVVLREKKTQLERNVIAEESANIKNSLLFQYNWSELLQSAPTAINSMGACFIAATSSKQGVTLDQPEKGFQYLRYNDVAANLVETANLGRYAFNEAETGMGQISQASDIIQGKLKEVLQLLNDPESARTMLKPQMQAVARSAETSATTAGRIEKKFQEWLFYACEMHAACVQQERTTAGAIQSNEICQAAEQTRLEKTEQSTQSAKAATDLLSQQVKTTSEAFKQASNEFPSGWDIVGQQIVGDLASAATTALKAAIPALVSSINPLAGGISQGKDALGGFLNKDQPAAAAPSGVQPAKVRPPVDNTKLQSSAARDPVAAELLKDMTYIEILNTYVNGPNGGIDWEKASGDGSDVKKTIQFITTMLEDAKSSLSSLNMQSSSKDKVLAIYETVARVANGINQVVKKSSSASATWPAADSPEVKKWVADFKPQYNEAQKVVAATAAAHGGLSSTGIMSDTEPATGDNLKAGQTQAQSIMESATNRLNTTQAAYLSSQDNYLKANALLVEQQNKLAEISAQLRKLAGDNVKLTQIKAILIEAIKLIIQLKNQINNLVQFFSAITVVITNVVNLHVEPFIDTVKRIVSGNGEDPNANWQVGKYTLTDYMRTNLFTSVLTLRTYFSVFGDVAKMWIKLSIENITPGLKICDELSVTSQDNKQVLTKMKSLSDWSDKASANIRKIAGDKQAEFMNSMDQRIEGISKTTELLPPPPAKKFIEAGQAEQAAEVKQSLEVKKKSSPMNRFSADDIE